MSFNGHASILVLAAVLVCGGAFGAAAQESQELVTSPDPFILVPPTTALDTSSAVNLPPPNTELQARPSTESASAPDQSDSDADTNTGGNSEAVQNTGKSERPTPKNVTRIDNDFKRKRHVQAVAVITSPLAPWGYTRRYQEGDVAQPEHPFGSGAQGPGLGGQNNRNRSVAGQGTPNLRGFGRGSRRDRRDDDE
jgi:hypothetical protein